MEFIKAESCWGNLIKKKTLIGSEKENLLQKSGSTNFTATINYVTWTWVKLIYSLPSLQDASDTTIKQSYYFYALKFSHVFAICLWSKKKKWRKMLEHKHELCLL